MNIALKEWAVVVEALAEGRQHFLLRKGGIAEGKRGFEPKHRQFLLYPTWEHQHAGSLQPEFHSLFEQTRPRRPGVVTLEYLARLTDAMLAPASIAEFEQLSLPHVWDRRYLQMRYDYRPERPLFVLVVRLFRLRRPVELAENRRYAGCRSWVSLLEEIDVTDATPTASDESFTDARNLLIKKLYGSQKRDRSAG